MYEMATKCNVTIVQQTTDQCWRILCNIFEIQKDLVPSMTNSLHYKKLCVRINFSYKVS